MKLRIVRVLQYSGLPLNDADVTESPPEKIFSIKYAKTISAMKLII